MLKRLPNESDLDYRQRHLDYYREYNTKRKRYWTIKRIKQLTADLTRVRQEAQKEIDNAKTTIKRP